MGYFRVSTRAVVLGLVVLLGAGCAFRIAGQNQADHTWRRTQSETAIASGYGNYYGFITVTYNDETGTEETILFTPSSRTVLSGASLMGWSYSTDRAKTWTYRGTVV